MFSPAFSSARSLSEVVSVFPVVSGFNPSDQLRIKAIPEVEAQEMQSLRRFVEEEGEAATAAQLAGRLNAYNAACVELKAQCSRIASGLEAAAGPSAAAAGGGDRGRMEGGRRREDVGTAAAASSSAPSTALTPLSSSEEEELQKTLHYLYTGKLLRVD